jgi:hypothetical protein
MKCETEIVAAEKHKVQFFLSSKAHFNNTNIFNFMLELSLDYTASSKSYWAVGALVSKALLNTFYMLNQISFTTNRPSC